MKNKLKMNLNYVANKHDFYYINVNGVLVHVVGQSEKQLT